MNKQGPLIRKRIIGRLSDGSDRSEVDETFWLAQYVNDDGVLSTAEFDHDPSDADVATLTPRRASAKAAVQSAVQAWQDAEAAWSAASTTAQALNALHLEHVALMRGLRALAFLDQIDN